MDPASSFCIGAMISAFLSLAGYTSMCFFKRYRDVIQRLTPFMFLSVFLTATLYFLVFG